ncbi:hypothetical protein CFD26_105665 [Aspergillus turcosus]|uniref:Ornithine cyclodeaminase n=1 Tax=Aspergillus turcosus TaxID=1245748 RepID=A0A421D5S6_9EURO|nr:hypothetical protein CFD26_105665 [Aspergillus turcosus]
MHIISEADLAQLLRSITRPQCERLMAAMVDGLAACSSQESKPGAPQLIHQPLRTVIVDRNNNTSLFMPASDTQSMGIKIVTIAGGSGSLCGVINIFSPDGRLLGLISAGEITAFRTALATMALFVRCTLPKQNIVVLGAGQQAEWHARLALLLHPAGTVKSLTVVNRRRERLESLETKVLDKLRRENPQTKITTLFKEGNPDYDETLKTAIGASDAILSCTPSTVPNFPFSYLQSINGESKQRFISLIGSYKPHMMEIDSETVHSGGKIFVDSKEACLEEAGELVHAGVKKDGLIEIGEVFAAHCHPVEMTGGQNIIFKCVGMGIMDLVIGKTLLDLGIEAGIGADVAGF